MGTGIIIIIVVVKAIFLEAIKRGVTEVVTVLCPLCDFIVRSQNVVREAELSVKCYEGGVVVFVRRRCGACGISPDAVFARVRILKGTL